MKQANMSISTWAAGAPGAAVWHFSHRHGSCICCFEHDTGNQPCPFVMKVRKICDSEQRQGGVKAFSPHAFANRKLDGPEERRSREQLARSVIVDSAFATIAIGPCEENWHFPVPSTQGSGRMPPSALYPGSSQGGVVAVSLGCPQAAVASCAQTVLPAEETLSPRSPQTMDRKSLVAAGTEGNFSASAEAGPLGFDEEGYLVRATVKDRIVDEISLRTREPSRVVTQMGVRALFDRDLTSAPSGIGPHTAAVVLKNADRAAMPLSVSLRTCVPSSLYMGLARRIGRAETCGRSSGFPDPRVM